MIVYSIRPEEELDQLICPSFTDLWFVLDSSEHGDKWVVEILEMTEEEIHNLPEHDGWW